MEKWVALGLASLFGIVYAWLVRRVRQRRRDHGLTPFLVAGGVAGVALCALGLTDLETVAWLLGLFGLSGLPLIWEYYDQRWRLQEEQRQAWERARTRAEEIEFDL
jgi:hypothetical protein